MSDPALASRLDRIERRQKYVLVLLVYPYLFGITWLSISGVELSTLLTAFLPGIGIVVVAYFAALVRARSG